jgi:hypothetical protein
MEGLFSIQGTNIVAAYQIHKALLTAYTPTVYLIRLLSGSA